MTFHTNELLRYCRKRLRQLYPQGNEPTLRELSKMTTAERMREASRSDGRLLARAQWDIFEEIKRFVLRDMGEDMKGAPYILQAWVNGVYFYYFRDGTWREILRLRAPEGVEGLVPEVLAYALEQQGAKTFATHTEAEAFIRENFDPNEARDSILVVPLMEVQKCEQ